MCAARQTELFPAIDPSTPDVSSEKTPAASCPAQPASARQKTKSKQSGTSQRRSPKQTDVLSPWMAVAAFFRRQRAHHLAVEQKYS